MNQDKANASASDEDIIFPDNQIEINGELITVKEINYMQGLQLHFGLQPMLTDMAEAFTADNAEFSVMEGVFSKHQMLVNEMIEISTGKDESWLHSLDDEPGQSLLMLFWMVNSGFFTRRLVSKSIAMMQAKQNRKNQADTVLTTEKSSAG